MIVPESFPAEFLHKFGVSEKKVRRFRGIKEDVYLSDFAPDEKFQTELAKLGVFPKIFSSLCVRMHPKHSITGNFQTRF